MLINEASKKTNLTKKAIQYYIDMDLIFPQFLENGYRDFKSEDIDSLRKIAVLRKLGIGITQIKKIIKSNSLESLKKIAIKKELNLKREESKNQLLNELISGSTYSDINLKLNSLEVNETITNKLLDSFPGCFGQFICFHFSTFLNMQIKTEKQQQAYNEIINFLDEMNPIIIPLDLKKYLDEINDSYDAETIKLVVEKSQKNIENYEEFISNNKKKIEEYLSYKETEEFKQSPAYKIQTLFKKFNQTNGYYKIFIPAMKNLSDSYNEYSKKIEESNAKFIKQFSL